jgi:hypothetical protein
MMTAYIDESGHEGKGWMFLAGYLGNEDQWKTFVPAWKAGLGPQRKSLHMTDLRWNKDRTKHLLKRLGPIPEGCGLNSNPWRNSERRLRRFGHRNSSREIIERMVDLFIHNRA